jgi:site-specific DNA-methyltransferase (adenine-specific)
MKSKLGMIHNGDCIAGINALPQGCVDLVFADPPFNIGYKYDVYEDRMATEDYLKWSHDWMTAVHQALKPDGTFWLAIGDDFAAELKIEAQKIGFHCRSWVVWYYTFGVNCKYKFTRSHTHLFHFVKDREHFTFRSDDLQNRVPSARMLVYNDKRGNPKGRLPDDTWIIPPEMDQTFTLRPQDLDECYQPNESDWYFPRVAGTFKERAGFHGCQMPEQLLGRIIRTCSEENEIVLDPFSGSASTLVVAKKLKRQVVGFELSEEYAKAGTVRLAKAAPGDELTGAAEPTMSAPKTWQKRSTGHAKSKRVKSSNIASEPLSEQISTLIDQGILSAYTDCRSTSLAELVQDEAVTNRFVTACGKLGIPGSADFLIRRLQEVIDRLPAEQQNFEFAEN